MDIFFIIAQPQSAGQEKSKKAPEGAEMGKLKTPDTERSGVLEVVGFQHLHNLYFLQIG